ncbi:type I restriction enzyme HsdR N-terminal domain-containing protein [uncultured Desulfobacter sp.]|uniref:type I restriction enzyme HsdR N-terminal domain-containing protein n=1 Tax=uncultured Desulfobacter sp. TaxID=240139 RepID=UPI0029C713E2|nr:type I restriction enzyme HsdR N-terminal domain-containing protein [uncultured Desulfobacter sp.]
MILDQVTDYITGKEIDNVGAEASRQIFEKFLVETKGYAKSDILVDVPLTVQFKGEDYPSVIDLIVNVEDRPFMAITCVAGSIGSYEREILAGARLVYDHIVPFSVSTDARDAIIKDAFTGKTIGQGLDAIPDHFQAKELLKKTEATHLDPDKRNGEMIIYRSFNLEKVNK